MRIYVGNLGYETSEPELRQTFAGYGQVEDVSVIQDRDTGRSKGFAFVEMPTRAEAQAAIEGLNGKELAGRTLTVNEARPRQERTSGGRGGGVGGRGSGGFDNRGGRGGFGNSARGGGFHNARKSQGGGRGRRR